MSGGFSLLLVGSGRRIGGERSRTVGWRIGTRGIGFFGREEPSLEDHVWMNQTNPSTMLLRTATLILKLKLERESEKRGFGLVWQWWCWIQRKGVDCGLKNVVTFYRKNSTHYSNTFFNPNFRIVLTFYMTHTLVLFLFILFILHYVIPFIWVFDSLTKIMHFLYVLVENVQMKNHIVTILA